MTRKAAKLGLCRALRPSFHSDGHGAYDECTSLEDRKTALPAIPKVTRPRKDPVYGKDGPLMGIWRQSNRRQS